MTWSPLAYPEVIPQMKSDKPFQPKFLRPKTVLTTDCPMSLRSETQMHTDVEIIQAKFRFESFTREVRLL